MGSGQRFDCAPASLCRPANSEASDASLGEEEKPPMSFPVKLKHRGKTFARIYKRPDCYRLYWRVRESNGKRKSRQKEFVKYSAAKKYGEDLVSGLANDSEVTALTPAQARDAMLALKHIRDFYIKTGKEVSLHDCAVGYCNAMKKLGDRSLDSAVDGFLTTVAKVKKIGLLKAVEEYLEYRRPETVAAPGKRASLSKGYFYNLGMWLKEFAKTFPNKDVADLTGQDLGLYMGNHNDVGAKSRNERRGSIAMFLNDWCAKPERMYVLSVHNLLECDAMKRQRVDTEEIEPYTADELKAMLDRASKQPAPVKDGEEAERDYRHLLPLLALVALGGIRLQEAARLTFEEVWRVEGHIEVKKSKAKTRARRVTTMPDSLRRWLEDYRDSKGPLWTFKTMDHFHREFMDMLGELKIPARRNGLRHGFISAHFALHSHEGLTAREAGTSPAMVHSRYNEVMKPKDAKAWFEVVPDVPGNVLQLKSAAEKAV
jgi:integrase